jgi:DUF2934 family protein
VRETKPSPDTQGSRPVSAESLHEAICRRAEEIYIRNGRIPGRDLENWSQAEQEIWREAEHSARRVAVVIEVDGVRYVGEYPPEACDGYRPGEFGPGADVAVRFEEEKMFVKRSNGKELETTIVKKSG